MLIGDYYYFRAHNEFLLGRMHMPTMIGTVYVVRWNAPVFDENALVSGTAGKTWSLSSLAYADGRLYARTMKELICIGRGSTQ